MHKYRLLAKKGEGTFSEVLKAQCIKTGKYVAIKCMKNHFDSLDQVNNLREIQALRRLSPNGGIVALLEALYDQPTGRLALVFELMDMNLYELIRGRKHYLPEARVKDYMYQLLKSMDHMHRNGIFHRDIKPENILIMDDCLKLADFGSCRGIYSKQPYTEYISTRWYRAPECLLTDGYYNYKMDMWGVGCVFFEVVSLFPLFPGTNELDQIQKIHNVLGTPPPELLAKMKKRSQHMDFNFPSKEGTGIPKLIPHVPLDCVDLVCKLLAYNPDDRLSARQALKHPYFREIREAEKRHLRMTAEVPDATPASTPGNSSAAAAAGPQSSGGNGVASPPGYHGLGSGVQSRRGTSPGGGGGAGGGNDGNSDGAAGRYSPDGSGALPMISSRHHGSHGDGDDGSLPPIGNLSLEKANAALSNTGRRAAGGYNMALSGSYKPGVSNGLSASTLGHSTLGSNSVAKRHHSLAKLHQMPGGAQSSGKVAAKANASLPIAAKGGKYMSPYSLRNLAGRDQAP
mmetsp:Transcript_20325/g.60413  ORF Transcript_20325/g.60413 Transcript_20325/m.60413 type:complete len:514 (-) Transcript_20325:855-2396(-)